MKDRFGGTFVQKLRKGISRLAWLSRNASSGRTSHFLFPTCSFRSASRPSPVSVSSLGNSVPCTSCVSSIGNCVPCTSCPLQDQNQYYVLGILCYNQYYVPGISGIPPEFPPRDSESCSPPFGLAEIIGQAGYRSP